MEKNDGSKSPVPSGISTEEDPRQCRCMFCGETLLLHSEGHAIEHMRECPALQEQLNSPEQFTIPKAIQEKGVKK